MIKRQDCVATGANVVEMKTHIDNAILFTVAEPGTHVLKQHSVAPVFSVRAYHETNTGIKSRYLHLLEKNVETIFRCAMLSFDPKIKPQSYSTETLEYKEENAVYGCIYPEQVSPSDAPRGLSARWARAGFDANRELRVSVNYLSGAANSLVFDDFQQCRGDLNVIDPSDMTTGDADTDAMLCKAFNSKQLSRFQENLVGRLETLGCSPHYYAAVSSAGSKRAFQVLCFRLQATPDFVYETVLDAYALKLLVLRNALGKIPD